MTAWLRSDRRGVVAVMFGLMLVPILLSVGAAIDVARTATCRRLLQDAVDNAALAGGAAYTGPDQANNAAGVARTNFASASFPTALVVGTPSVTTEQGTTNFGGTAYNVTVTVSASLGTTFMSLAVPSLSLAATATASNPLLQPKVSLGSFAASAQDWNAVYLYAVPTSNGVPDYATIPPASSLYEIGSNCNRSSAAWSSGSRCNGQAGASVPAGQTMPVVAATQPLAFALENMTGGLTAGSGGYGNNGYGAQPGHTNWFYSAYEALAQPPSQTTNYSYTQTLQIGPISIPVGTRTTTYPTTANPTPNCSLLVQQVDPAKLPTSPPAGGKCFGVADPASGSQYATLSCAQMAGRTFMFWWNDMGGGSDDRDYNDAYYTVSCTGGGNGGGSGTGNAAVVLTR